MRSTLLAAAFLIALGGLIAHAQDPKGPPPDPKTAQPPVDPKAQPPVPPQPPVAAAASDFFPVKKGNKWKYKYAEAEVDMEIKDVTATGEVKMDTLSQGKVVASETLKLQGDGLYRTKINNLDITPPLKILDMENKGGKLVPKAKGTKWPVDVKVQQAQLKGEYTIGEPVTLKLNGVDVTATPVEAKLNIGGTDTVVKYWFAAGKGQVKVSYTIAANEQAMELKTYEEGK